MKNILILNGSIRGKEGNSFALAKYTQDLIRKEKISCEIISLSNPPKKISTLQKKLEQCSPLVIISGTYWNNIGSPLQRFLEIFTAYENTKTFFGKPISVIVSMDSAGGLEVASKIHSSFSGLGCWSPPCSSVVISRTGLAAIESTKHKTSDPNEDVWRMEDISVSIHNLIASTTMKVKWKPWPHAAFSLPNDQYPAEGDINFGTPIFIP